MLSTLCRAIANPPAGSDSDTDGPAFARRGGDVAAAECRNSPGRWRSGRRHPAEIRSIFHS